VLTGEKAGTRDVVEIWLAAACEAADATTDRRTLQERTGYARSSLLRALNRLQAIGLVEKHQSRPDPNTRRTTHYVLKAPDAIDDRVVAEPQQHSLVLSNTSVTDVSLRDVDPLRPDEEGDPPYKADRFGAMFLLPAFNRGHGPVTKKETRIWQGRRYVDVTVSASSGLTIPRARDIEIPIFIKTHAERRVQRYASTEPEPEGFLVHADDLTKGIGLTPSFTNKRTSLARLQRFRCDVSIEADQTGLLEQAGITVQRSRHLLPTVDVWSADGESGRTPAWVFVAFHPEWFPLQPDYKRLLTVHKDILFHEQSDQRILLWFWMRRAIQRSQKAVETPLYVVHRETMGSHPEEDVRRTARGSISGVARANFRRTIEALVRETTIPGRPGVGYLGGYYLCYDRSNDAVVAWADPFDPLLGPHGHRGRTLPDPSSEGRK